MRTSILGSVLLVACGGAPASSTPADAPAPDAAAAASSAAPEAEDPWTTFTYAPGTTVDMPGTPTEAGGELRVIVLKRSEGNGFSLQCIDAAGPEKKRTETLAGMRRGVIGERKVLSEKPVERDGKKGVQLTVETATTTGTTQMHVLLLVGAARVCNFMSIVSGAADLAETERFLASAHIQ